MWDPIYHLPFQKMLSYYLRRCIIHRADIDRLIAGSWTVWLIMAYLEGTILPLNKRVYLFFTDSRHAVYAHKTFREKISTTLPMNTVVLRTFTKWKFVYYSTKTTSLPMKNSNYRTCLKKKTLVEPGNVFNFKRPHYVSHLRKPHYLKYNKNNFMSKPAVTQTTANKTS